MKLITLILLFATSITINAQWSKDSLSIARDRLGSVHVGDNLIFAGGLELNPVSNSNVVDIFNLSDQSWTADTLSAARDYMTISVYEDKAFFVGSSGARALSKRLDIYDTTTGEWSQDEFPNALYQKASAILGDKLFVGGDEYVDIYDISSQSWSEYELPEPRSSMCAVTIGDKVIFAGGSKSSTRKANVDIYDQSTDTWSEAMLGQERTSMGCVSHNGKAYFAGGVRDDYSATKHIDIYDLATDSWSVDSLSQERFGLAAAAAQDVVAFAGGSINDNWQTEYTTVDILNVKTGEWRIDNLSEKRYNLTAIGAGNKLYFAGGGSKAIDILEVETSSVDEDAFAVEQFEVFPNPTSQGKIILNLNERINRISLFDTNGSLIHVFSGEDLNDNILDLSHLQASSYYIKVDAEENRTYVSQVIILKR